MPVLSLISLLSQLPSVSGSYSMFEITAEDIALLNDKDLRELIGLLCESEVRRRGLPTSSVTWGGDQNAKDGGLDVRVALPPDTIIQGFIPRPAAGFQVKKPDMPRAAILAEMRSSDEVRPVIHELAEQAGAYIIVSSNGSTSDSALRNRLSAMAEAVSNLENKKGLYLQFYDRSRIATWVRDHAGLIPWVRRAIGKAVSGWQSYGAWAYVPEGASGEYLLDEELRIQTGHKEARDGLQAVDGLNQIRAILHQPGTVVRIVGLSGVGKTRFVQALFDARVGEASLDPSLAIYANMSDSPDPQPTGLASDLIAARTRAILVIDNCPPELHRSLSELARAGGSSISVVTIEYDIREDEPEGTEVFSLEPSSSDLIERLVKQRFPTLSSVNAQTVAEVSGGNARIAIALAATVEKNESVAGLTDEDLFRRLFQQRQEHNESLLLAAQACALVYSFQGEDVSDDPDAELVRLGRLVEQSATELRRHIAELTRRDLVQQRNVWRAVLPHAIANRLARTALQNISYEAIDAQIAGSERLLKSFSRRLGYLHKCEEAVAIVEKWLAPDGLIGSHVELNLLGQAIFENIVPTAPEAALSYLERVLSGPDADVVNASWKYAVRRLRSLAYDPVLFDRCVALLAKLAEKEDSKGSSDELQSTLVSLFPLYLSGTHAPIERRLAAISTFLSSNNPLHEGLGLQALDAVLEAWHFSSHYEFEFGAHSRDHGYWPQTAEEVRHWYESGLAFAERWVAGGKPRASDVRTVIANKFRGLWTMAQMFDVLERVCHSLAQQAFWREGWIAVRQTILFDTAEVPDEIRKRLEALDTLLTPRNLIEKTRSIVLTTKAYGAELDEFEDCDADDIEAGIERADALAQNLGKAVANDSKILEELLPELVAGRGRLFFFGRGLAIGTDDPYALWKRLGTEYTHAAPNTRNELVFRGFLHALKDRDSDLTGVLLDEAVENAPLAECFPSLQTAIGLDEAGLVRLMKSLALGKVAVSQYGYLAWGKATASVSALDLKKLLLAISLTDEPSGYLIALDILYMHFHLDREAKRSASPELIEVGRALLRKIDFKKESHHDDHRFSAIADVCLTGDEGAALADDLCRKLKATTAAHEARAWQHVDLLQGLMKNQPVAVLNCLFGGEEKSRKQGIHLIEEIRYLKGNPVDGIPDVLLSDWCDVDPAVRYPIAASVITMSHKNGDEQAVGWTDTALHLLEKAPDRLAVLKVFIQRFHPRTWSGSRASIIESNIKMLDVLIERDAQYASFIEQEKASLVWEVQSERARELAHERDRDERFE